MPISRCLCPLGVSILRYELLLFAMNCYSSLFNAIKRYSLSIPLQRMPGLISKKGSKGKRPQIASTCDSQVSAPRNTIRKRGVQFGNHEAIRADLRIDSRKSGHLSVKTLPQPRIHPTSYQSLETDMRTPIPAIGPLPMDLSVAHRAMESFTQHKLATF